MRTKILLSIDPGETNGVCAWDLETKEIIPELYVCIRHEAIHEFMQALSTRFDVDYLVIELFEVFRNKATKMIGNRMITPQMIGVCKTYGNQWGAKIIERRPMTLAQALKIEGLKMPSDHSQSHHICARAHGAAELRNLGLIKSHLGRSVQNGQRKSLKQIKEERGLA